MAAFFRKKLAQLPSEKINFDSFIKFSLISWRMICFDFEPMAQDANLKEKIIRVIRLCYAWMSLVMIGILAIQMALFAKYSEGIVGAASSVLDIMSITLIVWKTVVVFLRKNDLLLIFEEMKSLFELRENEYEKYDVKKYLDKYRLIVKVGLVFLIAVIVNAAVLFSWYFLDGTMKLAANAWFPFNIYQPIYFPVAALWLYLIVWFILICIFSTESLLCALITVISMEFDFLKQDFFDLRLATKEERKMKISSLIDRHNKLLDIAGKLQNVYSSAFLGSFLISSFIICSCSFQLVQTDKVAFSNRVFFVDYLALFAGQIFLLCMLGQKLIDSSLGVAEAVYESGWEDNEDDKFKKQIQLIILRAQRPKIFQAMDFAGVSLESFTTVSFMTVMAKH